MIGASSKLVKSEEFKRALHLEKTGLMEFRRFAAEAKDVSSPKVAQSEFGCIFKDLEGPAS